MSFYFTSKRAKFEVIIERPNDNCLIYVNKGSNNENRTFYSVCQNFSYFSSTYSLYYSMEAILVKVIIPCQIFIHWIFPQISHIHSNYSIFNQPAQSNEAKCRRHFYSIYMYRKILFHYNRYSSCVVKKFFINSIRISSIDNVIKEEEKLFDM